MLQRLSRDFVALGDRYRFLIAHADARADRPAEAKLKRFIAAGQRAGELRQDLSADWMLASYGALIVAAADQLTNQRPATVGDQLARTIAAAFSPAGGPSRR